MSRREIVLLVSRAISILQIISALIDVLTTLPLQSFLRYKEWLRFEAFPESHGGVAWPTLITVIARIAVTLVIALLFWNGGPTIERMLMPASTGHDETRLG